MSKFLIPLILKGMMVGYFFCILYQNMAYPITCLINGNNMNDDKYYKHGNPMNQLKGRQQGFQESYKSKLDHLLEQALIKGQAESYLDGELIDAYEGGEI